MARQLVALLVDRRGQITARPVAVPPGDGWRDLLDGLRRRWMRAR